MQEEDKRKEIWIRMYGSMRRRIYGKRKIA
jgi:hypothetical protein